MTNLILFACLLAGIYLIKRSKAKRRLRPPKVLTSLSVSIGLLVAGLLVTSFVPAAGLAVTAAAAIVLTVDRLKSRRLHRTDGWLVAWPRILEETIVRIQALGESFPLAFINSGLKSPEPIRALFSQMGERYEMGTDMSLILTDLSKQSPPPNNFYLEQLSSTATLSVGELLNMLRSIQNQMQEQLHFERELKSKLAGVKIAKFFIIAIPLVLALAGIAIAGINSYLSSSGIATITVCLAISEICLLWSNLYIDTRTVDQPLAELALSIRKSKTS
jgi:Flp pilus assembly protein TadB